MLTSVMAQITVGHVDDFENLSVSGWAEGPVSPNPPTIVDSGGPDGAGDAFMRNVSSGTIGAGSMWVVFNQSGNWTGNYTVAGVMRISMDVKVLGAAAVHLRIALNGPGGTISSADAITIMPGQEWQNVHFEVTAEDFVSTTGGGNVANTLSAVSEIRILHNPQPSYMGEIIAATVDLDNISVEAASALGDTPAATFTIFPNPASDVLQMTLPDKGDPVSIELFDARGVQIVQKRLTSPFSLDISNLREGLYYLSVDKNSVRSILISR